MLLRTTSPISCAMMPVIVCTGWKMTPRPDERSGVWMRLPAQSSTTIVSPTTRPKPRRMAAMMPERAAGTVMWMMVWSRVAPSANGALS